MHSETVNRVGVELVQCSLHIKFKSPYDSLVNRHQKANSRLEKLNAEHADKVNRERELRGFIDALATSPLVLDAWDEQLWRLLVVRGVIGRDGSIEFEFRGGENVREYSGFKDVVTSYKCVLRIDAFQSRRGCGRKAWGSSTFRPHPRPIQLRIQQSYIIHHIVHSVCFFGPTPFPAFYYNRILIDHYHK